MLKDPNDQDVPMTAASYVEYDPVGFLIVDQARIPATGNYTLQVKLKDYDTSPAYFPQKAVFIATPCSVTPSTIQA